MTRPLHIRRALEKTYAHPLVRRTRAVGRLLTISGRWARHRRSPVVEMYWWDGHPNFGDALTPWLLSRSGIIPVHVEVAESEAVGVGSLLQFVPDDYRGVVWGTGLISAAERSLPNARAIAVRGPQTRSALGLPDTTALGDPGLLAATLESRPRIRYELGLVPHGDHFSHPDVRAFARRYPGRVKIIDVARGPGPVIRDIASCRAIVSSSLHGVIVADSYGIPAAWITLDPSLIGGEFKFLDHESVVLGDGAHRRIPFDPAMDPAQLASLTRRADHERVRTAVAGLERSILELRDAFRSHPRGPAAAWRLLAGRKLPGIRGSSPRAGG